MSPPAPAFALELLDTAAGPVPAVVRGPAHGPALLIVPPLYEEMNRCRRLMAETGAALARRGVRSWLIDLPGAGDSGWGAPFTLAAARRAVAAAAEAVAAGHVLSLRGGALIDDAAGLPACRFAPAGGRSLLRDLLRARVAADAEAGAATSPAALMAAAAGTGTLVAAGYAIPATEAAALEAAVPTRGASRTVGLVPREGVEAVLAGAPVWRQSEPVDAADLARALAEEVADWMARTPPGRAAGLPPAPLPEALPRVPLAIEAPGARLAAMLHPAEGATGVIIVPGAPQGRVGAHAMFVALADALAGAASPVLRLDRRGLGDSAGSDPGFRAQGPDLAAAAAALRARCPAVRRVVGLGLCDGAAALALAPAGYDALVLLNPWAQESDRMGDLPPRAAIARRYRERALSPATLRRALRGEIAIGKALRGLVALAQSEPLSPVAGAIAAELARFPGPVLIVLGERDATAQTFGALWQGEHYRRLRARADREVVRVPNATHTFPGEAARALAGQVLRFVAACSG